MKIFRLQEWDNNSGVTHIATTWQIATDKEFTNVIDEVIDSEEYKNFYKTNIVVPVGKVYYVRAKRKFKEVENDVWIGPKPIISEEAGTNEVIKPPVKITEPYIKNITLDYEDGLTIELADYEGNVPHRATNWIIKNVENNEVLVVKLNDEENLTSLNIKNDEIDFTQIPYIKVYVSFISSLGTESPMHSETLQLSRKYYEIIANKKIVPIYEDYKGEIKQTTIRDIKLKKAELFTVDGKYICSGDVEDNKFSFKMGCLVPKNSYRVRLWLYLDNDETTMFTTSYTFFTKGIDEKIRFDTKRGYNYVAKVIESNSQSDYLVGGTKPDDLLNPDLQVLTEETYIGFIPMVNRNNKLSTYLLSKTNNKLYFNKNLNIDIKETPYIKFELMDNDILIIDKVDKDNNKVLETYKVNPYNSTIESLSTLVRDDELVTDFNTNTYGVLNNEFYWASIDKDDKTKIIIKKLSNDGKTITTLYHNVINGDKEIDNVCFGRITKDRFIIIPIYYGDEDEFFGFTYDVSKNEVYKLFTVPKEVRNKNVLGTTLDNGNFILFTTQLDDNSRLYSAEFDSTGKNDVKTNEYALMIDDDTKLVNLVRLKSGNVLLAGFNDKKEFTDIIWS